MSSFFDLSGTVWLFLLILHGPGVVPSIGMIFASAGSGLTPVRQPTANFLALFRKCDTPTFPNSMDSLNSSRSSGGSILFTRFYTEVLQRPLPCTNSEALLLLSRLMHSNTKLYASLADSTPFWYYTASATAHLTTSAKSFMKFWAVGWTTQKPRRRNSLSPIGLFEYLPVCIVRQLLQGPNSSWYSTGCPDCLGLGFGWSGQSRVYISHNRFQIF